MPDAMVDSGIDAPPACTTSNTFGAELVFDVGATGTGFAVGNLDPGGKLDVAVAVTTEVVILHGDGTGTVFNNPTKVATAAIGVAIEDFDILDARKDLVLWGGNSVVVRRQDGNPNPGTFLAEQPLAGPFQNVTNVAVEFFDNGNLLADLIVQDELDRRVFEQLGTAGTFSRTNKTTGVAGDDLVVAREIDGVNRADAMFVDQSGNVKLSVSSAGGALQAVTTIATGATGRAAAFGKFDGDALVDLVVATAAGGVLYTQNAGAPGTFTQQPGTIPGVVGSTLLVSDINMDGTDDIVVPGSVVLQCPGATPGIFTQVESLNSTAPALLVDLDANGKPDLLRLVGTNLIVRLQ